MLKTLADILIGALKLVVAIMAMIIILAAVCAGMQATFN